MGRRAVGGNTARATLAADRVGRKPVAGGDVVDFDPLKLTDTRCFQQQLVDRA